MMFRWCLEPVISAMMFSLDPDTSLETVNLIDRTVKSVPGSWNLILVQVTFVTIRRCTVKSSKRSTSSKDVFLCFSIHLLIVVSSEKYHHACMVTMLLA